MEKRIQIFLSDAGQFREASKHKFIAEFADERVAKHYVDYLFKKYSGKNKDIIVEEYQLEHVHGLLGNGWIRTLPGNS